MAFQFKIQLNRISKPPVTRELVVNDNISFHKFHEIIQIAMGWAECHLYMCSPKGYGSFPKFEENTPDAGIDFAPISYLKLGYDGTFDSGKVKLKDYFEIVKDQITYIYDFGDDWKHTITLIKITDLNVDKPFLTKGKGKCPPEDCGGIWGYERLLKAINDPKDPEHRDFRNWLGMKKGCLLYTSPSPRDRTRSRMPSSA